MSCEADISDVRPSKRAKTDDQNSENGGASLELPAEVWAHCCHYLPYHDVRNLAAVNKTFLNHVMPAVSRIHLFKPKDLHAVHARRMKGVERVYINSLLKKPDHPPLFPHHDGGGWCLEYCNETKCRVIPYLTYFRKLRYVFLGAMAYWEQRSRNVWDGCSTVTVRCKQTKISQSDRGSHGHRTLVHAFCGAFACGAFQGRTFKINGLFHARATKLCPNLIPMFPSSRRNQQQHQCQVCGHVMNHFPTEWLILARGSFLCVSPKERFQRVIQRGDRKLLTEDKYVHRLVEEGFKDRTLAANAQFRMIGMNSTLFDLNALVELKVMDPKTVDPNLFYNRLKKLKTELSKPIKFSERDFKALVKLGFRLDQKVLEEAGIPLCAPPQGFVLQDFLNHINGGQNPPGGVVGGFAAAEDGNNVANAHAVEVNIEGVDGLEGIDVQPLYANIFDRVRDVVREQLGDAQAERFGELHDQVIRPVFAGVQPGGGGAGGGGGGGGAGGGGADAGGPNQERRNAGRPNQEVAGLHGGIIIGGGLIGQPLAMGFGGPPIPPFGFGPGMPDLPPLIPRHPQRQPDGNANP